MTSQKTLEELKDDAKEAGVKGYALYKDADKLEEAIKEAGTAGKVAAKRSKAPRMQVNVHHVDERAALVKRLEADDPECKYVFQPGTISDRQLKEKGLERTEYSVRNDVLCRTMKDSYLEVQQARRDYRLKSLEKIDNGSGIIDSFEERQRAPRG